jgi:arylsulfatase A-like enzyme
MICIDDLNDWVGFLDGHPQAITPNMDALARRGRIFANAHCAVPVCSCSRVSVMSGVAATTHGSYEIGPKYEQLPALAKVPTIQRYFKDNGYYTLSGGKVLHHGFGGRLVEDIDRSLGRKKAPRPKKPMNRPDHWSGAWDWGAYPADDAEMNPKSDLDDLPPNFLSINDYAVAPTHAEVMKHDKRRSMTHAYLASISFVDHCVGTVVDALASSPHADNTIVVLWSDHGFHLGEKQHWAKRTLWEESTRVPLLFIGPGIKSGEECREPASLIDIYPTLVEMCGLPANQHLEGVSLVPQLKDPSTPREQPAITSSYFGNHSVRSRDWRLVVYEDGPEELYDHRTDPNEFKNLAGDPAHKAIRDQLAKWIPDDQTPEFKEKSERLRRRKK